MSSSHRLPTYFISHGGGPWPWMKAQMNGTYDQLEASLRAVPEQLGQTPQAVLVISGHWEAAEFTVMSSPRPPMVHDYAGFPEHTYQIRYEAPGSPELAKRVQALITSAGFPARLDTQRGYDHGTFVPLFAIYPHAEVPVLQLSMKSSYDPAEHLALGRALAPFRDAGVPNHGSGPSYHNLRAFGGAGQAASQAFDQWLQTTVVDSSPAERSRRLLDWASAPAARLAHPREDHLVPLMVAVGAAEGESARCVYHEEDFFGGITVSSFMFGEGRAPA